MLFITFFILEMHFFVDLWNYLQLLDQWFGGIQREMNPFVIISFYIPFLYFILSFVAFFPFLAAQSTSASLSGWQSYHQPNSVFFNKFQQRHFSLVPFATWMVFRNVKNTKQSGPRRKTRKTRNPWSYGRSLHKRLTLFHSPAMSSYWISFGDHSWVMGAGWNESDKRNLELTLES